jgi:hypothetical protein
VVDVASVVSTSVVVETSVMVSTGVVVIVIVFVAFFVIVSVTVPRGTKTVIVVLLAYPGTVLVFVYVFVRMTFFTSWEHADEISACL